MSHDTQRAATGEAQQQFFATSAASAAAAVREQAIRELPFENHQDEADARRGFIGTMPDAEVPDARGKLVWSDADYSSLNDPLAPATAHPALWRRALLNPVRGPFKVTDRIYQVRGFDFEHDDHRRRHRARHHRSADLSRNG
jgi:alkyl sulfatase BDS1-like metallo-beta-lactamase superfamily hydrolase